MTGRPGFATIQRVDSIGVDPGRSWSSRSFRHQAVFIDPDSIAWLAQTSETASDIMQPTNTSGTAQVLSLTYDPGLALAGLASVVGLRRRPRPA